MILKTMAMKITPDNWSVAVAILGPSFASTPQVDVIDHFVVVNVFDAYQGVIPSSYYRHGRRELTLTNILLHPEEFKLLYDYDKRKKHLEDFFDVVAVRSPRRTRSRRIFGGEAEDEILENEAPDGD